MKIFRLFVAFTLICFALPPAAHALVPAPDGGYPNFNTAEGQNALFGLTTGGYNTAVGYLSLRSDATGSFNTGVGAGALLVNTGDLNTAIGAAALLLNAASSNTAVGSRALLNDTTGGSNTVVGDNAMSSNSTGSGNVAVGAGALDGSTGDSNVGVGQFSGHAVSTASNVICIGSQVFGANVDNSCYIGNIWAQPGGSQAVFVGADGKLGAQVSSRRFKEEIKQMNEASQSLFALTPVSFRYTKEIDPTGKAQFGLVAEDVAKVNPDLVIFDKTGKPYTVRYDQVNAMLLNEFLKEHKTVQQQGQTIARLEKQLETVTATLQKVSAQLEVSKASPQTVLNQ
jgi:hypothetical protein